MYNIVYEKRICKDLDKYQNADVEKILAVIDKLAFNPFPHGSKKLSGMKGLYRIRQGNYRIIYMVDHKEKEIRIILINHRKEVYRGLN